MSKFLSCLSPLATLILAWLAFVSAVFPAAVDLVARAGRQPGLDQLQGDSLRAGQ